MGTPWLHPGGGGGGRLGGASSMPPPGHLGDLGMCGLAEESQEGLGAGEVPRMSASIILGPADRATGG